MRVIPVTCCALGTTPSLKSENTTMPTPTAAVRSPTPITKTAAGYTREVVAPVRFVPMTGRDT